MSVAVDYNEFLTLKRVAAPPTGFNVPAGELNELLFPWQRDIVQWALRRGCAALFAECGLGKTAMQLEWARQISLRTRRPVLILAPLAVAKQTQSEGVKFGIPVTVARCQADIRPGVNVANYEMLDHFEPSVFGGVVLDESSILKAFMGKIKRAILEAFAATPYRLACTATPAPNDHLELGNHAEFLGVMPSNEMISRWFINDTMSAGTYRLKGHAAADFWRWVSTWAVSASTPADLGHSDAGYVLPPLQWHTHIVEVDLTEDRGDQLFRCPTLSSTGLHAEKRRTVAERAAQVARLVGAAPGPWVVWCDTNYESDALRALLPEAVDLRGCETVAAKEAKIAGFQDGSIRVLVSKPSILGFGLNFQHCSQTAFVGLSYSYEAFYQAVRRFWRFGQERPVDAHIVLAESELSVLETIRRKQADHETMKTAMTAALRETQLGGTAARRSRVQYQAARPMTLPAWLSPRN